MIRELVRKRSRRLKLFYQRNPDPTGRYNNVNLRSIVNELGVPLGPRRRTSDMPRTLLRFGQVASATRSEILLPHQQPQSPCASSNSTASSVSWHCHSIRTRLQHRHANRDAAVLQRCTEIRILACFPRRKRSDWPLASVVRWNMP